jgi:GMP synthase-like glutamine amidotransferase
MKIGILQTGHAVDALLPVHGDYDAFFRRLLDGHGFDFATYRVVDGEFPGSIRDADGWLITGSRHGAYDDLPWIAPLEDFIRDAYAADVPMAGICFGHQIMAQALGGKVEKHGDGWIVGRTPYRFADGRELQLNAWHQDQVVTVPPDATVTARSPGCTNRRGRMHRRRPRGRGPRQGDAGVEIRLADAFLPAQLDLLPDHHRRLGRGHRRRLHRTRHGPDAGLTTASPAPWTATGRCR